MDKTLCWYPLIRWEYEKPFKQIMRKKTNNNKANKILHKEWKRKVSNNTIIHLLTAEFIECFREKLFLCWPPDEGKKPHNLDFLLCNRLWRFKFITCNANIVFCSSSENVCHKWNNIHSITQTNNLQLLILNDRLEIPQ